MLRLRTALAFTVAIAALAPNVVAAQAGELKVLRPGGGDLNPGLYTDEQSIERFQDLKVGLSVHWGPSSLGGKEISWSRGKEIPKDTYDSFYKDFNPVKFDADAWMKFAQDGGMRYIILTSKHHDGFALWPSKHTPYNIAATPFKRDVVREISDAARRHNIVFGSYYSILDWYHPDYQPYDHGGPGELIAKQADTPKFDRYLSFMKGQLRELVQDYGAEIIQFDGEWDKTWTHQLGSDLYLFTRYLNPKVLVSNRTDVGRDHLDKATGTWNWRVYAGDFDERERMVDWIGKDSKVFGRSDNPWQAWVTIDNAQWSWNETPRLQTSRQIILDLVKTVGDGGNFLINLGPKPDGSFDDVQAARIREVGSWLKRNGRAIYNTRRGPFSVEGSYTSTVSGKDVFLMIIDPKLTQITLSSSDVALNDARDSAGKKLRVRRRGDAVTVSLPKSDDAGIRIIHLPGR